MKANKVKWAIAGGVLCVLLLLLSVWYAATFNGGRLVEPMDFSTYTFQVRDLPMLCSTALFTLTQEEGQALLNRWDAQAMWVDASGQQFYSPGFSDLIRT